MGWPEPFENARNLRQSGNEKLDSWNETEREKGQKEVDQADEIERRLGNKD